MDYLQEDSQENNLLQFTEHHFTQSTRVRICCIRAWVLVRSSKPLVFWREKRTLVPRVRDPKLRELWEPALVTAVTLSTHVQKTLLSLNAWAQSNWNQDFLISVLDFFRTVGRSVTAVGHFTSSFWRERLRNVVNALLPSGNTTYFLSKIFWDILDLEPLCKKMFAIEPF